MAIPQLSIAQIYSDRIIIELCVDYFVRIKSDKTEFKYSKLYWFLREYIILNLSTQITTSKDRQDHSKLFDHIRYDEISKNRFNAFKYEVIWNRMRESLADNNSSFNLIAEETSKQYASYLNEIEAEWETLENQRGLRWKLKCRANLFGLVRKPFELYVGEGRNKFIRINPFDDIYTIELPNISKVDADNLEWILTSNYLSRTIGNRLEQKYFWFARTTEELTSILERIIIELWEFDDSVLLSDESVLDQVNEARLLMANTSLDQV